MRPIIQALCYALLLPAAHAFADGQSMTSVYDIRFQISDLTPGDGNAAGFFESTTGGSLYASVASDTLSDSIRRYPDPFVAATVEVTLPPGTAEASIGPGHTDISTYATGTQLGQAGSVRAEAYQSIIYWLAPYTAITMTGDMSTLANPRASDGDDYRIVSLIRAAFLDERRNVVDERTLRSRVEPGMTGWDVKNTDFALYYANDTAGAVGLQLRFDAASYVLGANVPVPDLPAIPEPGSGAMLGAGLFVLAGLAWRRRRAGRRLESASIRSSLRSNPTTGRASREVRVSKPALRHAIAAIALALTGLPALADGDSRTSITVDYISSPVDLRPDDGIPPWYNAELVDAHLHLGVFSDSVSIGMDSDPDPNFPASLFLARDDAGGDGQALAASGPYYRVSTYAYGYSGLGMNGYVESESHLRSDIVLGAYTGVTFHGRMHTQVSVVRDAGEEYTVISTTRVAYVDEYGNVRNERRQESRIDKYPESAGSSESDFVLFYGNDTADEVRLSLLFDARSYVVETVSPVPEPSVAAMLVTGLLLTGGGALRRRARNGAASAG